MTPLKLQAYTLACGAGMQKEREQSVRVHADGFWRKQRCLVLFTPTKTSHEQPADRTPCIEEPLTEPRLVCVALRLSRSAKQSLSRTNGRSMVDATSMDFCLEADTSCTRPHYNLVQSFCSPYNRCFSVLLKHIFINSRPASCTQEGRISRPPTFQLSWMPLS